mmetsp:Transcript_58968/g.133513  ORF Transcript_58968/g.133513 Transcript_58968/m.133513 type:complete len:243 (+) Transcript_58968:1617-2345(+)
MGRPTAAGSKGLHKELHKGRFSRQVDSHREADEGALAVGRVEESSQVLGPRGEVQQRRLDLEGGDLAVLPEQRHDEPEVLRREPPQVIHLPSVALSSRAPQLASRAGGGGRGGAVGEDEVSRLRPEAPLVAGEAAQGRPVARGALQPRREGGFPPRAQAAAAEAQVAERAVAAEGGAEDFGEGVAVEAAAAVQAQLLQGARPLVQDVREPLGKLFPHLSLHQSGPPHLGAFRPRPREKPAWL